MSELTPQGFYIAMATPVDTDEGRVWAQFGETSNGNMQVLVHFEILEGPHMGVRLPWFGYFTKDSATRTIESLRLAGFKGDDLEQLPFQQLDQKVSITVEHNTNPNSGKTHARVAWVNAPGGGGIKLAKPLDKNGLRRFSAQMKNHVRQAAEVQGERGERGKTPTPDTSTSAPPTDSGGWSQDPQNDDIPF